MSFGQRVDAEAADNTTSVSYVASSIIKPTAGRLFGMTIYNSKSSTQFIQLHDSATLPADNAIPKVIFEIAGQSARTIDFGLRGRRFGVGIVVCNSSTGPTKTIGSADCWFDSQWA